MHWSKRASSLNSRPEQRGVRPPHSRNEKVVSKGPRAMGITQIILSEQDRNLGQIGGGAWLTDLDLWPKDPQTGQLMLPVITMTSTFLDVPFIPAEMALTAFICVERKDENYTRSSVRQLAVHQQSEMEKLKLGRSCVLLHTLATTELTPQPWLTLFRERILPNSH
jgi:hypothetical protein